MKKPNDEPPERARDADGLHKRRGVWYFCLMINGQRKFFSTRSRTYQEARKVRQKAEEDQKNGRLAGDLSKQKFELALHEVLEARRPHLAPNTVRLEKERSGPLLRHFAGLRVAQIDAHAIAGYQGTRAKEVSPRTVNLECKVLRIILPAAKVWARVGRGGTAP